MAHPTRTRIIASGVCVVYGWMHPSILSVDEYSSYRARKLDASILRVSRYREIDTSDTLTESSLDGIAATDGLIRSSYSVNGVIPC